MGVKQQRAYEEQLDMTKWRFGGQCPSCSGVLKYQYYHTQKANTVLKVLPNKGRFEVVEKNDRQRNIITLHGKIADMKTLLQGI
jgi:hypothetical protein